MQGNGQTELTEALVGLEQVESGTVVLEGRDVTRAGIDAMIGMGVGYVPEDRLHDGLVSSFTVAENLVLDLYHREPFSKGISLDLDKIQENAEERVEEFDVRTSSIEHTASTLSGGNQQKVVLARELSRPLKLLIVAQPTRGLDVGSMEFVHRRIVDRARQRRGGRRGVHRARRGARPRRPDRGHVPRQDHRRDARRSRRR